MGEATIFLSIDFGSEHIRVAKTRYNPQQSQVLNPQIVEFGGRRSLRNIVLLTPDLAGVQEVGEGVFTSDCIHDTPHLVRRGLSLGSDPESETGRSTCYLLEYIYRTLDLANLSDEERQNWQTLLVIPTGTPPEMAERWRSTLIKVNFPDPRIFDGALATLLWHRSTDLRPGLHLVLDCGATYTRGVIYRVDGRENIQAIAVKTGRPGGRDFDRVLIEHFDRRIADSTLLSPGGRLEMGFFVEGFKEQMTHAWAIGQERYEALYPIPSAQTVLGLQRAEFESVSLAGELIAAFRSLAAQLINESGVAPSQLLGVYLAGGGAHWPFVYEWAKETVGDRVVIDEYPEESAVKGIAYLAVTSAPTPLFVATPPKQAATPPFPPPTPAQAVSLPELPFWIKSIFRLFGKQATFSPGLAFWIEFVFGLFGVMGMGWYSVLQNILVGCPALLGWWLILAVTVLGTGILSVAVFNPLPLLIVILVWLSGPLLSASLAYWVAKRRLKR